MDLEHKPLYALRDLAARLGVDSPTVWTKTTLLQKIAERKAEIEENRAKPKFNNLGRPRLNTCYIAIKKENDGTLTFYENTTPPSAYEYCGVKQEPVIQIIKPVIEDDLSREKLEKAREILGILLFAINNVLDN